MKLRRRMHCREGGQVNIFKEVRFELRCKWNEESKSFQILEEEHSFFKILVHMGVWTQGLGSSRGFAFGILVKQIAFMLLIIHGKWFHKLNSRYEFSWRVFVSWFFPPKNNHALIWCHIPNHNSFSTPPSSFLPKFWIIMKYQDWISNLWISVLKFDVPDIMNLGVQHVCMGEEEAFWDFHLMAIYELLCTLSITSDATSLPARVAHL